MTCEQCGVETVVRTHPNTKRTERDLLWLATFEPFQENGPLHRNRPAVCVDVEICRSCRDAIFESITRRAEKGENDEV